LEVEEILRVKDAGDEKIFILEEELEESKRREAEKEKAWEDERWVLMQEKEAILRGHDREIEKALLDAQKERT